MEYAAAFPTEPKSLEVIESAYHTFQSSGMSLPQQFQINTTIPTYTSKGILAAGMLVQEFIKDSFNLSKRKMPMKPFTRAETSSDRHFQNMKPILNQHDGGEDASLRSWRPVETSILSLNCESVSVEETVHSNSTG